jgi:zinc protease
VGLLRRISPLALLLLLLAAPVRADSPVTQRVLDNGLTVLVKEVHTAPLFSFHAWYRVGSRNEHAGITGISHLLEHMTFKGTRLAGSRGIDELVTARGGYENGFTWLDYTGYVETLPRDSLELAFRIEAERMSKARLTPEDLEPERRVVISEMEGDQNDNAFLLETVTRATAFQAHSYRHMTIGWNSDVSHITAEQLRDYYHTYYLPNNATIVIVGDVETDQALALAAKYFGQIPRGPDPPPVVTVEPPQQGERRANLELPGATDYLNVMYHVPAIADRDHYALEVLQLILSGGKTTRLPRALVDTGLASSADAGDYENIDPTVFQVDVTLKAGVSHTAVEQALERVISQVQTTPVSEHELQQAKNQTKASFVYSANSTSALAYRLGYYQTILDYRYLDTFTDRIDAVTAPEVQRVARRYLTLTNRTVGWFTAKHSAGPAPPEASARPAGPQRYHADSPAAATAVSSEAGGAPAAPPVHREVLGNGLVLIVQENPAVPMAAVYANIIAGPIFDPADRPGLADFTARMLLRGTRNRTRAEIDQALEFVAAGLGFGTGTQVAVAEGRALRSDVPLLLQVLADAVRNPSFPEREIRQLRGETLTGLAEAEDEPGTVGLRALYADLYPQGHPLHNAGRATTAGVKAITRADLVRFHKTYYRPDSIILAVVGDVKAADVRAQVERLLGDWKPSGSRPSPSFPQVALPAAERCQEIALPQKAQSDVFLGFPGISRLDPDYYAADLMNRILGGGFVSRLNKRIREQLGLAYYVYSYFQALHGPGPWILNMGVNPRNVNRAVDAAVEVLNDMQSRPPTDEELTIWKGYAQGQVVRRMEEFSGVAENLVTAEFYGLGLDFPYRYPKILAEVTADQVLAAAKKHLYPGLRQVVIAGPPLPKAGDGEPAERTER